MEILLAFLALALGGVGVIAYDNYTQRKHVKKRKFSDKFIFLRSNSVEVRKKLQDAGINLCTCAYQFTNPYLYTSDGTLICGFCETSMHFIEEAKRSGATIIDCGVDIQKFVNEIRKAYGNESR